MSINFFIVVTISIISATQNCVAETALNGGNSIENINGNISISSCETVYNEWKCCSNFTATDIELISVCISLRYLDKEYGGEMKVTVNNFVIIDEKLSLVNPPPICADVPYLEKIAKVCFYLYDLSYHDDYFTGCAKMSGKISFIRAFEFKIACFNIPLKKKSGVDVNVIVVD